MCNGGVAREKIAFSCVEALSVADGVEARRLVDSRDSNVPSHARCDQNLHHPYHVGEELGRGATGDGVYREFRAVHQVLSRVGNKIVFFWSFDYLLTNVLSPTVARAALVELRSRHSATPTLPPRTAVDRRPRPRTRSEVGRPFVPFHINMHEPSTAT
jgi:hypothetical protein